MHRTAIVMRADCDETLDLDDAPLSAKPRTSFSLRIIGGPDAGKILQLDPNGPSHAVVGHASSCAIQLTDRHVSRKHIALTATTNHVLLVDLGSTNGTRVNGVIVREARLYGGETVAIGRTIFRVETDGAVASVVQEVASPSAHPAEDRAASESAAPPPDDILANILREQLSFPAARQRVLQEFEKRYIGELLARHDGNVTRAARASGIAHRYFQLVRARTNPR